MALSRSARALSFLGGALLVAAGCASGGAGDLTIDAGRTQPPTDGGGRDQDARTSLDARGEDDGGPAGCESAADCDDGDACNGLEACEAGLCAAGLAVDCDDGVECTADSCDATTGTCAHPPDDARCGGGMICDPIDGCEAPVACESDAACDDGVFCNGVESCDPATGCRRAAAPTCDDGIACTIDACDAATDACASAPSDGLCDDGLACNGSERCDPIAGCAAGLAVACSDGIACTVDTCVEPGGTCISAGPDADGDGFVVAGCAGGNDCNDLAPAIYPGATEICDGVDDDCSGVADDGPGMTCAAGSAPQACTTTCGTSGARACTGSCTLGPCRASAETCGNSCDDDGNGVADDGCPVAPIHDTCPAAMSFTIGATLTGTTVGATNDYGASCAAGSASPDVAYAFVSDGSARSYRIRVDTTSHDGSVHVHGSSACASADELACNDDFGGTRASEVTLTNLPQGTYYVVVDGFSSGNAGPFTLTSSSTALSPDTCAGVVPITANGTYTGTTAGRAADFTGTCGSSATSPDVVYSITARTTGTITVTTCGSSYDTVLHYATACGGATVGCNDDSCGVGSSIAIAATAGTTYYVVVDGYSGASGTYSLNVSGY